MSIVRYILSGAYLVIKPTRVQTVACAKYCDTPVWHHELPGFAYGIGQELDRRLRQGDGWEPEGVEGIYATTDDAKAYTDKPHPQRETR